jgi:paraquat-inducible protein B
MSDEASKNAAANPPAPHAPRVSSSRFRPSLVWVVPAIAALIGISLLAHAWLSAGPQITISFQAATGLEAGKTTVKYKDVVIGNVTAIALADDNSHVIATVDLKKSAEGFAREGSRFWVVRPRIGAGGVSGVETMLSGAYIGVDAGQSTRAAKSFVGLETPPTVINGTPGKSFILHADDLGSLEIGAPVYYRRIQVGQVAAFHLDDDGKGVTVQVFIDAPNDRFVSSDTRFWNASGVDLSLGANGLKLNTQSLATVIAGGIAFATPPSAESRAPATEHTQFKLAADQQTAMAESDGSPMYLRMRFDQSLRGLEAGAPVEFMGSNVGNVSSVYLDFDPVKHHFSVVVDAVVYPQRLSRITDKVAPIPGDEQKQASTFIRQMVDQGLRAQPRPGNILTGQLYIAFDFMPNLPRVAFDINARPLTVPTVRADFSRLQEQVASIVGKLDKVPFDSIGQHLDESIADLDKTLKQVNNGLLPEARNTLQETQRSLGAFSNTLGTVNGTLGSFNSALAPDAPLPQTLNQTLLELQRSARSLRTFTDMLGRNPESMIRGRAVEVPVPFVPAGKAPVQTPHQPESTAP